MLKDIELDKKVLPFHLKVSFDSFQKDYILAKKSPASSSIDAVYKHLHHDFFVWANLLEKKDYHSNINIYTLMRLLKADDKTPGTLENKLNLLTQYMHFFEISYLEIIQESFLLHMNKASYIPQNKYRNPKDLFYYIAKEIKMFIFSIFRKYINYQKKQNLIKDIPSIENTFYHDYFYDKNILNDIPLDMYKSLIYSLLTQNTYKKISKENQERYLCRLIKTLLSSN
jgi:hypothetical protein